MADRRPLGEIASEVLRCAMAWEPDARLIGNVTALEIARLAAQRIEDECQPCPLCGAEAGCDIDCGLCLGWDALTERGDG